MTEPNSPLSPTLQRRLTNQIDTWRRDLLTLDRRQKLVYFKHTRTGSLEIASPDPDSLFVAVSKTALLVTAEDGGAGTTRNVVLVSGKTEAEVTASCRRLDLMAQRVYADRGFWTLYLGLGILRWVDPADGKAAEAPIVLCPVAVQRSGSQAPFQIRRTEDDLVVNPALRLHLDKSFGIDLPPSIQMPTPSSTSLASSRTRWSTSRAGASRHALS